MPYLVLLEIFLFLFLFLMIVGTLRELAIVSGRVTAITDVILRPPEPTFLGKSPPTQLIKELDKALPPRSEAFAIAMFLRPGCQGCDALLGFLRNMVPVSEASSFVPILPKKTSRTTLAESCRTLFGLVIVDEDDELFDRCEVRSTPMLFAIDRHSQKVVDFAVGPNVEWVSSYLGRRSVPPYPEGAKI